MRPIPIIEECEFRYFAQAGPALQEIPPAQFPKAIAGQNLGFSNRYFGGLNERLDAVQIARDMDPADIYFRQSLTAYIWNHLATGEPYSQSYRKATISQALLEEYIRTNRPIQLTAIMRNKQ